MGDRITLATVPDAATAELLREVLVDGGVADVDVRGVPGNPYLGRVSALDYAVRVLDVDEVRARLVLAQFEEESGQAATSQAAGPPPAASEVVDEQPLRRRKPYVLWGFLALATVVAFPLIYALLETLVQSMHR